MIECGLAHLGLSDHNAGMQNPPKIHHYIPKFLSRRWADADGLLFRFTPERPGIIDRRVHFSRVGWKEDLYKMPGEDGHEAQRLEQRYLRELDNRAALALDKMLATPVQRLNENDVGAWAMFTLSLLHRSPTYFENYKRVGLSKWWEAVSSAKNRYSELKRPEDPETYEGYVAALSDEDGERAVMENLPSLLASERILGFMASAPWLHINIPNHQPSLLLSDAPIVMTNGVANPGGHLALPISPRRLLLVARDRDAAIRIDRIAVREIVRSMNRQVVSRARHFVASDSITQATFIQRHFGIDPNNALLFRQML